MVKKSINYSPMILKEEILEYNLNTSEKISTNNSNLKIKRSTDQLPDKLIPLMISNPQSETLINENVPKKYLNCTSTDVECGKIICDIGSLSSYQDTGGLQLDFSINPLLLWNNTQESYEEQVVFTTDALIDVIKPVMKEFISGTNLITYTHTIIYKIDSNKNKSISIWIIIGSVLLGLVALFIIAIILYKVISFNFFFLLKFFR